MMSLTGAEAKQAADIDSTADFSFCTPQQHRQHPAQQDPTTSDSATVPTKDSVLKLVQATPGGALLPPILI